MQLNRNQQHSTKQQKKAYGNSSPAELPRERIEWSRRVFLTIKLITAITELRFSTRAFKDPKSLSLAASIVAILALPNSSRNLHEQY